MKIYLNDRTIRFLGSEPDPARSTDLVVKFVSNEQLNRAWVDFQRYEKFQDMLIIEPGFHPHNSSAAMKSFFSFFKPVPAAGGLVKNERGEFLFIHRFGHWDLPKGKIDKTDIQKPGDSIHDLLTASFAAIREVKEETGLKTLSISRNLPSTWHIYPVKDWWALKETRWFEMVSDSAQKLTPATREGIFHVKWASPGSIHCILPHTYASLRELLLDVIF